MSNNLSQPLEFAKVKDRLAEFAVSPLGRAHIEHLEPQSDPVVIRSLLDEVQESLLITQHGASVPLPGLDGIGTVMTNQAKGYLLTAADLTLLAKLLDDTERLRRFMLKQETVAPRVASYASSLYELKELSGELFRCIRNGRVDDHASPELGRIRKKQSVTQDRIRKKLDGALSRYRSYLQEQVQSMRGDRYVIPVKKEYRKLVPGAVLDESASGQTVFVEPADIAVLHAEWRDLLMEETREEDRILGELTELVDFYWHELSVNLETIGHYDFLFAKARYAAAIGGRNVELNTEGHIRVREGRHPLLERSMVPLDVDIGGTYRALLITGPNTGGKTVCLKTVGLLTLMVQAGLLPPVAEGSRFAVFAFVLADIGDGQSIEQSLSTFSSHVKSMIAILNQAGPSSLVLLDELAAGTDPGEGIGLSIALLEALYRQGATIMATTHFGEIKRFAERTPGFVNARMEFDTDTLQPLYRLTVGQAGASYAFQIASRLGMPGAIIARSREIAAGIGRGADEELLSEEEKRAVKDTPGGAAAPAGPATVPLAGAMLSEKTDKIRRRPTTSATQAGQAGPASGKPHRAGQRLEVGDCVWIHTMKRTGILKSLPDERGMVSVLVQKQTIRVNLKRLSLYIERKELYPPDYDMDIVFENKDTRKKRKLMSRKHMGGLTIEHKPEE